jgi:hypothetical protein
MSEPPSRPTNPTELAPPKSTIAWQPFTPRGVAAFAAARFGRLFTVQLVVAVLASAVVVWFVYRVWFPAVREAIRNLPEQGSIRAGQLSLPPMESERIVTNRFLTFAVDAATDQPHTFSADVFVMFRQRHYEICSLFGCAAFYYPTSDAPFNRLELEAKWGAWQPILFGMAAIATALALLFLWCTLATLYFLFVWVLAFFADRELTLGGSWRLCGAALVAGTVLLLGGMASYGLGALDLIRLLAIAVMHVVLPWVLIIWAVFVLRPVKPKRASNPFANAPKQR